MASTIPGGAYLSADGKTWHDAEGKKLTDEQVKEAKRIAAEQTDAIAQSDAQRTLLEANRDPVARVLLSQQQALAEGRKAGK